MHQKKLPDLFFFVWMFAVVFLTNKTSLLRNIRSPIISKFCRILSNQEYYARNIKTLSDLRISNGPLSYNNTTCSSSPIYKSGLVKCQQADNIIVSNKLLQVTPVRYRHFVWYILDHSLLLTWHGTEGGAGSGSLDWLVEMEDFGRIEKEGHECSSTSPMLLNSKRCYVNKANLISERKLYWTQIGPYMV